MTDRDRSAPVRPIFIGGCERSGTTLLGSMLGAHEAAIVTPESQFKTDVLRGVPGTIPRSVAGADAAEGDEVAPNVDVAAAAAAIRRHWRFRHWGLTGDVADANALDADTHGYAGLLSSLVRAFGRAHGRPDGTVWIDHSPNNVRHATALAALFPDARFVHIVRDARAVVASVRPLDWGPNTAVIGADWWVARVAHGLALETAMPERTLRVRYEDLVTAPEATLRGLCDAVGLAYRPAMVAGGGMRVVGYTADQHRLVGAPPDASRVAGYRDRLRPREIEIIEAATFELLPLLGYRREHGVRARPAGRREKVAAVAVEATRRVANRLRWRRRLGRSLPRRGEP